MNRDQYQACKHSRGSILRALDEVPHGMKLITGPLRASLAELDREITAYEHTESLAEPAGAPAFERAAAVELATARLCKDDVMRFVHSQVTGTGRAKHP